MKIRRSGVDYEIFLVYINEETGNMENQDDWRLANLFPNFFLTIFPLFLPTYSFHKHFFFSGIPHCILHILTPT